MRNDSRGEYLASPTTPISGATTVAVKWKRHLMR